MPAFEKQPDIADRVRVGLVRRQPLHAGPEAAMDVVLQTRRFVNPAEIDLARRNLKEPVNKVHEPVRQIARKVRPIVRAAVLPKPPRHIHSRKLLSGQFDVGIGLVIAQQDVETRLVLLDQIVFERQRFFVVVDLDEIDIPGFADQRPVFASASLSSLK